MFETYISDLLEYCQVKWYDLTNKFRNAGLFTYISTVPHFYKLLEFIVDK